MCDCVQPTNLFPLLLSEELVLAAVLWCKALPAVCMHAHLISSAAWENVCGAQNRRRVEVEEYGGNGRRYDGRAGYEGGGALQQLSCEEANGLSSPSHAHCLFSDGHSSGETHIGLATGTELQPVCLSAALLGRFGICLNSS